ncbi:MAG TPA: MOSC domain-containing protein [Geminicoccaceae bacterium]|nr:MOSC domain-containing protein [Geminicoccaceae bacterium]
MAQIAGIYRYPIKGLSAEPLRMVEVAAGQGLPLDRKFALARPNASFDPERPAWLPKRNFLMLMTDERLATLRVAYEDAEGRLTIEQGGERVLEADLRTASGRAAVERFFEAFMGGELQGRPRLVSAPGHMFTDSPTKYVSLINLASVAELERQLGPVDPLRFRANLYVANLPAWAEFDWLGRELATGDARFHVAERIDRCAATNVDPRTGARDLNVPLALRKAYGHIDCGVLMKVTRGGTLKLGQTIGPG